MKMSGLSCPVCAGNNTRPFFFLERFPVQEGNLARTRESAIAAETSSLEFHFCQDCMHAWNRLFDPDRIQFDADYDINLAHSHVYLRYLDDVAKRLVRRYRLEGASVLEIACGKGDFLRRLVNAGMGDAHGFDPTWVRSEASDSRIKFHEGYFEASHTDLVPALICCRSLLQYLPEPRAFLSKIISGLSTKTVLYFEVPDGAETFRSGNVWNMTYEHGAFFNEVSLAALVACIGCELSDLQSSLGGSVLEVEASVVPPSQKALRNSAMNRVFADAYTGFEELRRRKISVWKQRFLEWQEGGKSVVLWGAGARAINFLCSVPESRVTEVVVDINPSRQGRFLPVTGQEVVAPQELSSLRPDVVIASNPHFAEEIFHQLGALGIDSSRHILR
jgi:SAM-dependent methyltransferase